MSQERKNNLEQLSPQTKACRRSRPEKFLTKVVLKMCSKFTEEHACQSCMEIALRHGCFPVNLFHIFRAPFSKKSSRWLLLNMELCATILTFFWCSNVIGLQCSWIKRLFDNKYITGKQIYVI